MRKKLILLIILSLFVIGIYSYNLKHHSLKNIPTQTSVPEIRKIDQQLASIVEKQDPRVALLQLASDAKNSNSIASSCHILAHNIGHAAFAKYQDFGEAMKYQNEVCNSGYLHGVIESYFSSTQNIATLMPTICQPYPEGSFTSWECYHGVGHGIMYFNGNNVPLALASCNLYQDQFSWEACINGVFMENFNTDQKLHPSKYLKATDPFYPCNDIVDKYKSDCYLYAPVYYLQLHKNVFQSALQWCLDAPLNYQADCTAGVGAEAMKENINSPSEVEQICNRADKNQIGECISGMVWLYINNFGSLGPARALCPILQPDNKLTCENVVQNYTSKFAI